MIAVIIDRNRIIVEEGETIYESIIPTRPEDTQTTTVIKSDSRVKGIVIADRVELYPGSAVDSGVVAREVVLVNDMNSASSGLIKIGVGMFGLERITLAGGEQSGDQRSEIVLVVDGDVISPRVSIENALISGNILSTSVILSNVIILGVLGITMLMKLGTSSDVEQRASRVTDSIVGTIMSDTSFEINGKLGLLLPLIYVKSGSKIIGEGEVVLLNTTLIRDHIRKTLDLLITGQGRLRELISAYIAEHKLASLPANGLEGVVSFTEVEQLPAIRKKRAASSLESLWEVLKALEGY